jgi:hypothetical protein
LSHVRGRSTTTTSTTISTTTSATTSAAAAAAAVVGPFFQQSAGGGKDVGLDVFVHRRMGKQRTLFRWGVRITGVFRARRQVGRTDQVLLGRGGVARGVAENQ